MMKKLTIAAVSIVCACGLVTMTGCSKKEEPAQSTTVTETQKGELEKAGAALDKAAKDAGAAVKEAAKDTGAAVKEAAKDTGAAVKEAAKDTNEAVKEAAKDAGAAVKEATTPAEKK